MTSPDHAQDHQHSQQSQERQERLYRRMLVAYPSEFRAEYEDDLVQAFRDLMTFSSSSRGVWWRTVRDLVSSAARERGSTFRGDGKPSKTTIFVVLIAVAASIMLGPGLLLPLIAIPSILLVGLPLYGLGRFRRAWLIRRTTGGAILAQIALGIACIAPAVAFFAFLGDEAVYWTFFTIAISVIVGSGIGIIWGILRLTVMRDREATPRRWVKPALVLVPSLAILGTIIGASYNSYRNSLGPPGDHSVANASEDTRRLWEAAGSGRYAEVVRVTDETCADPWVKFPAGNGRHNAKGHAEVRGFATIAGVLGDYMDIWYDECVLADSPDE